MTVVRSDTFTRANVASGLGTATDGNTWTIQSGNGQKVQSNEGQVTGSTASTFATLGSALSGADANGLVRFQYPSGSTSTNFGILLRWTDTNNHWLARYDQSNGGFNVMVKVSGTYTAQSTISSTLTAGSWYWLRFQVQGTSISIRFWADGSGEPGTWNGQYTLASQNVAGNVGLYAFSTGSNPVQFDSFSVDDLQVPSGAATIPLKASLSASGVQVLSGAATIPLHASLSASPVTAYNGAATIPLHGSLSASGVQVVSGAATIPLHASLAATTVTPGTGIGDITRTTGTQTANKSGNGYGSGDITGTEHDYIYKDATGSGWAVGANPWYGGMPISAWYQIDGSPTNLNTTLPQKTSANGNLMTLLTTQAGGIVHWEEAVSGTFAASENPTFNSAGNLSELAPANTAFRAYIKAIADATDANGIQWTAYACIYPGDPGFVVFRLDQHNPSGSSITFNESDLELIASLLGDGGNNPTGIWNRSNGYVNTIGNATATQWPGTAGSAVSGTFDYAWITPDNTQTAISLGTGAVVLQSPQSQFGWEVTSKYEVNDSDPNATKPTRIKFGWYSPTITYSMPAGATNTYYVLRVFSRGLTQAVMDSIAADYKFPGTPTTTTGSYTSFSTDERAYVFAASSNALGATLDLSPTHVTARHKPVYKITGWTDSSAPLVKWGGSQLTANTDYRYTYDATNTTLYVQLWFDVVASGATGTQRNNAALSIVPSVLTGSAATIPLHASLAATGVQVLTGAAAIPLHASIAASGVQVVSGAAKVPLHASLAASGVQVLTGAATVPLHASLSADPRLTVSGAAIVPLHALWSASGLQVLSGAASIPLRASLSASPLIPPSPARITASTSTTATITATTKALATITAGSTP